MAIRFVVSTEEEKQQLLEASDHVHYLDINTDLPMVNTFAHLYLAEDMIVIDPDYIREHKRERGE